MVTLQEEYFRRHHLDDAIVINHVTSGTLLFRPQGSFAGQKTPYVLATISWKEMQHEPGMFHFNYHIPITDGLARNKCFLHIADEEIKLDWCEYVNYILHWCRTITMDPLVIDKEVRLAGWQIFMYGIQDWLLTQDVSCRRLFWGSEDAGKPWEERLKAQDFCLGYLTRHYPQMVKSFNYEIVPIFHNYCYWLGGLIRRLRGSSIDPPPYIP